MPIHLLNQPDPDAPIDNDALLVEFLAGQNLVMDVPLSQTHLFALCLAAQRTAADHTCPAPMQTVLLDFLVWCSQQADFPPEMSKMMATQFACLRGAAAPLDLPDPVPAVQTSGQPSQDPAKIPSP